MKLRTNLPYIFAFFAAFLLALAVALAFADAAPPAYAAEKANCTRVSDNVALYAEYRDEGTPRETLIDKQLAFAQQQQWTAQQAIDAIMRIVFVYAAPDKTPRELRTLGYAVCMKAAGYTEA
jgi:hypothetical protein